MSLGRLEESCVTFLLWRTFAIAGNYREELYRLYFINAYAAYATHTGCVLRNALCWITYVRSKSYYVLVHKNRICTIYVGLRSNFEPN